MLERASFVHFAHIMSGAFPYAEPVVLVDREVADQHPICRALEVVDPPAVPEAASALHRALPLFVIDLSCACQ